LAPRIHPDGWASGGDCYAKVTADAGDELRTGVRESTLAPQWEDVFLFSVRCALTVLKVSVWDRGAKDDFLGEVSLEIVTEMEEQGQVTVDLRPRDDPHLNRDDLRLLNSLPSGLGRLELSWRFKGCDLQRRVVPTDPYTVVVQVPEVAELRSTCGGGALFYLRVDCGGGEPQYSQLEPAPWPKFRSRFEFRLQADYETASVTVWERPSKGADVCHGEISVPVGPSQSQESAADRSWVELRPARPLAGEGETLSNEQWKRLYEPSAGPPPRIQFLWKALRLSSPRHGPTSDQLSCRPRRKCRSFSGEDAEDAVRRLLSEVEALQVQLRRMNESKKARTLPCTGDGQQLLIVHAGTRRTLPCNVSANMTALELALQAVDDLGLCDGDYCLSHCGVPLTPDQRVGELPRSSTLHLVRGPSFRLRRSPHYSALPAPPVSPPFSPPDVSPVLATAEEERKFEVVLTRLRRLAGTPNTRVTVAVHFPTQSHRPASWTCAPLIQLCLRSGAHGFARHNLGRPGMGEVILQGSAQLLSGTCDTIVKECKRGTLPAGIELYEVKGCIPILTRRFEVSDARESAPVMWERCAGGLDDTGQVLFYADTHEGNRECVLYIDERAEETPLAVSCP